METKEHGDCMAVAEGYPTTGGASDGANDNQHRIEWTDIPTENWIAVTEEHFGAGEWSLIYTIGDGNTTKDGEKVSPYAFRAIRLSKLPNSKAIESFKVPTDSFLSTQSSRSGATPRVHVVVSTGSGTGLATAVWKELVEPLLAHVGMQEGQVGQHGYQLHTTTSHTSIIELTQSVILPEANRGILQLIVLLSGDGGVVDIVDTLLSGGQTDVYRKPTIVLLPVGSGNALANSAGIVDDKTMGLRTALLGSPVELPLFRATFSPGAKLLVNEGQDEAPLQAMIDNHPIAYGAVVCSWGLHASLVADSETTEYRRFGAERFRLAAKEALFPSSDGSSQLMPHAYQGRVSILRTSDGHSGNGNMNWHILPRTSHGYILATFCRQLEAGFTISPASEPLDGKLRLVHFGAVSGQEGMEIMKAAYAGGEHVKNESVGYEEIDGLRVDFEEDDARWRRVCIDGKIVRVEKGGWVEVKKYDGRVADLVRRE